jgi:hypothetical protein
MERMAHYGTVRWGVKSGVGWWLGGDWEERGNVDMQNLDGFVYSSVGPTIPYNHIT